jgi:hypothetical protein
MAVTTELLYSQCQFKSTINSAEISWENLTFLVLPFLSPTRISIQTLTDTHHPNSEGGEEVTSEIYLTQRAPRPRPAGSSARRGLASRRVLCQALGLRACRTWLAGMRYRSVSKLTHKRARILAAVPAVAALNAADADKAAAAAGPRPPRARLAARGEPKSRRAGGAPPPGPARR